MGKYESRVKENSYLIISTLLIFIIKYIIDGQISPKFTEIIYLLVIGMLFFSFYLLLRKRYTNMSVFFSLCFLLFGLLPYLHYLSYSNDKRNYTFDKEYLEKSIEDYKFELKSYRDSCAVLELKSKIYSEKINLDLEDKPQRVKEYAVIVKHIIQKGAVIPNTTIIGGRPNDRGSTEKELYVYKNGRKIANLKTELNTFKSAIDSYLMQKALLDSKIKNPEQFIPYNDIWLDSVTGFVFSFIKPLSKTSQLIRLFQLVVAYFLFHMLSGWLKLSKSLNIVELER